MNLKLLYVGMKYDYGDKARGLSFEHRNFYHSLKSYCGKQGWDFVHYDFMERGLELGLDLMTQELYELAKKEKPTYLFAVLFDFHRDPRHEVFKHISSLGTITIHWFCDDHWRFEKYSSVVAPHFDFVCTTANSALPKYKKLGMSNKVIKSQWACNYELYVPYDIEKDLDISFVGQPHGNRVEVLSKLIESGLKLEVFGFGWENRPRIPFHQMVRLFSRSKINLNLSNSSTLIGQQIKGRNFEIPGTRSFLLTSNAENLSEYYEDGKEIVIFNTVDELIDKAKYYLNNDHERMKIAEDGYKRTLAEHTWHHRFDKIFNHVNAGQRYSSKLKEEANQLTPENIRNSKPLVSVIIPCYNQAHFLPEVVESVANQTFTDWECIIVNDGSPDNTSETARQLIANYSDKQIRLIEKRNGGLSDARNMGIKNSKGKYILPLDSDDLIHPEMLQKTVSLLKTHPEIAIAYTDQIYFGAVNKTVHCLEYDFSCLLKANYFAYSSLYRKYIWEEVNGYNTNMVWGYEDWDFWISCGEKGYFGKRIPEPLFMYRVKESSMLTKALEHDVELKAQIVLNHRNIYSQSDIDKASEILLKQVPQYPRRESTNVALSRGTQTFKVIALISAHNEGDVIYHVIGDLIKQGVEVYFINHCSTDNTVEEASKWLGKGLIHIENFPQDAHYPEQNKQEYIWSHILKRKQELAATLDADWFIHHDADEFRESPWPGLSLFEAIYVVDRSGYNAIDFELLNFRPTDTSFVSGTDVRDVLKYYELSEDFNKLQIKAWKKQKQPVNLATTGGHDVQFEGKKVYPIIFILRHYPIRSQTHGMQKVFQERKSRFNRQERGWGWHVQYNKVTDEQYNFLYNPSSLKLYNESDIRLLLLSQQAYAIKQQLLKESGLSNHNMPRELFSNADDLFHCGAYNEAIDAYKKALETNSYPNQQLQSEEVPCLFDAYYNLALSYVNTHRLDDAITTFQKAVELHSGDAAIYNNLGVLYFKKKSYNDAKGFFEKALSLDNHYGEARQNLEKVSHALKNCSDVTPSNPDDNKVFTDSPVVSHLRDDSETTKCLSEQNEKFSLAVSIIILTWNALEYTQKCVNSIQNHTRYPHEIVFVDNASTDGTVEYLRNLVKGHSNYKLIENRENKGFAAGNNQGVSAACGEYVMLLNNDVLVSDGWLEGLVESLERDETIGMVGPITNSISGRQMVKGIPYADGSLIPQKDTVDKENIRRNEPDNGEELQNNSNIFSVSSVSSVHSVVRNGFFDEKGFHEFAQGIRNKYKGRLTPRYRVAGFAVLMRKTLYEEVNGLDESFGTGNYEDDDLCLKVQEKGYAIMVDESVFIHHYRSQTFIENKINYRNSLSVNGSKFKGKWPNVDYEQLLELHGSLVDTNVALCIKGKQTLESGNLNKAIEIYSKVLKTNPIDEVALCGLALAYQTDRKMDKTIDAYKKALKVNPSFFDACYNLALVYANNNQIDDAIAHLNKAINLNGSDASAHNNLGVLYFKKNRYNDAKNCFERALLIDTHYKEAQQNLGKVFKALKNV